MISSHGLETKSLRETIETLRASLEEVKRSKEDEIQAAIAQISQEKTLLQGSLQKSRNALDMAGARHQEKIQKIIQSNDNEKNRSRRRLPC